MDHKTFTLKFRNTTGIVTVSKDQTEGYNAFITFPKAYMQPGWNNFAIRQFYAVSLQAACEVAYLQMKDFYHALNLPVRDLAEFNFVVHRVTFRNVQEKEFRGVKYGFIVRKDQYAISEKVDGMKFAKGQFINRHELQGNKIVFFINYDLFTAFHSMGFNHKFIWRLMAIHTKVKPSRLKQEVVPVVIDIIKDNPYKLDNHISCKREQFYNALIQHHIG